MKKRFGGHYVSIPHKDLIELLKTNKANLGIEDNLAQKIILSGGGLKSIRFASHFWNWIGFGIFILSIYFSFTLNWYLFIFGFFAWYSLYKVNKKSDSSNILDQAKTDKEFYEKVRKIEGWIYNIDIDTAKKYKIRDGYPFEEN